MRLLPLFVALAFAPAALAAGLLFDHGHWQRLNFTPAAFSFPSQSGVTAGSSVTSSTVTLAGSGTVAVTATCNGCTLQRNGTGGFAASVGGFVNGDTIQLRMTAASTPNTPTTATVTVGTTQATWTVTTRAVCGLAEYRNPSGACVTAPTDCRVASACVTTSDTGLTTGAFVQTFLWDSGDCAGNDYCFSCAFGDVSTTQCLSGTMRCTSTYSDSCLIKVGNCHCL